MPNWITAPRKLSSVRLTTNLTLWYITVLIKECTITAPQSYYKNFEIITKPLVFIVPLPNHYTTLVEMPGIEPGSKYVPCRLSYLSNNQSHPQLCKVCRMYDSSHKCLEANYGLSARPLMGSRRIFQPYK